MNERRLIQANLFGPSGYVSADDGEVIECEANYAVFRTKLGELSTVFNVGRYLDTLVRTADVLRIKERLCVYDSELIPNELIYPI